MGNRSHKLAGDLYFAPVDTDGVLQGAFVPQGNGYPLTITVNEASEDMLSALRDTPGQILESESSIDSIEASLTLRQWGVDAIAYALAATAEVMDGEAGTVEAAAGATLTVPAAGEYVYVGHQNISSLVLSQDTDTDPETYIPGTDFIYDAHLGLFTMVDGGGLTAGDEVRYAYSYDAETGKQLNIGKAESSYVAIKGSLKNINTGKVMALDLYMVKIYAGGGITMISDPTTKFEELPLTLKLLTPPGQDKPGTLDGVPL